METIFIHLINIIVIISANVFTMDYLKWPYYVKRWIFYKIYNKNVPFNPTYFRQFKPLDDSAVVSIWSITAYSLLVGAGISAIGWGILSGMVALILRKLIQ